MSMELMNALGQLEKEKGISKEILIEAIEAALISAYKKNYTSNQQIRVAIDKVTGVFKVYSLKKIVEIPIDEENEISLEEAHKVDKRLSIDDVVEVEITPRQFGRIAAQTAKQVVMQRIKEAERGIVYNQFYSKEDDIVSGVINRVEKRNVLIDLGKAEAMLSLGEQVPGEVYIPGDRIKTYVVEVRKTTKGPQIMVSRANAGLVKRLFELEVPEIHDGTVEIKSVSREPGSRTKIAVYAKDENIDPVGSCVGQKGTRVQNIVDELRGEKIDIIRWSQDPAEFISSSLSPAKVLKVQAVEREKTARVVVPDFQLSLAIGREGQNARLAAKLTGWKIDIKSESQLKESIGRELFMDFEKDFQEEPEDESINSYNGNGLFKDLEYDTVNEEDDV